MAGLHLPQLRSEFGLLAASFDVRNPGSGDLLFADIEFAELQHSFHQFGVNSLPHVRLICAEPRSCSVATSAATTSLVSGLCWRLLIMA
jgi:oligosaccharyltransferase complex subunit gamma